ncbi:hypothetical protein [Paenibacillus sp. NRS-1781]
MNIAKEAAYKILAMEYMSAKNAKERVKQAGYTKTGNVSRLHQRK